MSWKHYIKHKDELTFYQTIAIKSSLIRNMQMFQKHGKFLLKPMEVVVLGKLELRIL